MGKVQKAKKIQASMDFLISYGIAILIILVALYVVYKIGIFNATLVPVYCTPTPPFACNLAQINTNGVLTISMVQAAGGAINITGIACSSAVNSTENGPKYGNVYVKSYKAAPQYYPNNALQNGLVVYPSSVFVLSTYCYNSGSGIATASLGNTFNGYVWLNFTYSGLPQSMHNVETVAIFSSKYS
ncbi:MAG: hypothetical protein ACP5FR_03505 [Candidatus Micrarchaeia archaeon]